MRQKQDLSKSACFHPQPVANSTPSSGRGLNEYSVSQLQNSEQMNNYGTEQNQFSLSQSKSSPIQNESGSVALRSSPQQTGLLSQAQADQRQGKAGGIIVKPLDLKESDLTLADNQARLYNLQS